MKKTLLALLCLLLILPACKENVTDEKIDVVATFYPLAYFAQRVGGMHANVNNLVPTGGEPHDFEPSPRQIVEVTEADMALYLGEGFEPWMQDLESELEAKGVVALAVNQKLPLVEGKGEHEEGIYDPHTWLDPLLAQEIVTLIAKGFIQADPENETVYLANAEALLRELQALHQTYQSVLHTCTENTILTSHNAFTYLAERYDIQTLSVAGLSPEEEPSADRLAQLADFAKAEQSKYIFFETLATPDVAKTLADEASLTPLLFNPIEGLTLEEAAAGENYFTLMQSNLSNLKLALICTDSSPL
ncbi:zinc ABC transporter substrate-binding protein [Candidatus Peregrinibacteria bacterium]|nr:MAG: zinc ABC transporter substrate-binding protein [Candidatus Peregrinibacteria bacterium]